MRFRSSLVAVVVVTIPLSFSAACSSSSGDAATDAGTSPGQGDVQTPSSTTTDTGDSGLADDGGIDASVASLTVGAACTADTQCLSGGCDDTMHCAAGRSCTQAHGGRTCGPNGDQSCCDTAAVPMPTTPFVLDKYNITAGRFRQFITKTQGNVRGYVQANRPTWFPTDWDAWLPNVMDDGTKIVGTDHTFPTGTGRDGVYQQLGPIHYGVEGPGNEGCLTKEIGNARTYRLPDAVNTTDFADVQQYTQDVLDEKPQQCTDFFMFAAFCIWDGGRMPTVDELAYAWDGGNANVHNYPWGNTPVPGGWNDAFDTQADAKSFAKVTPAGSDQTYANYRYNWWSPDTLKCVGATNQCDYSIYLAPPGRFPKGNGPFGHSDFTGNVYNMTMPPAAIPAGTTPDKIQVGLTRTGAFDGHGIPATRPAKGTSVWPATNKYLAVGSRCVRN